MVELQLPKLTARVRFPSPAPFAGHCGYADTRTPGLTGGVRVASCCSRASLQGAAACSHVATRLRHPASTLVTARGPRPCPSDTQHRSNRLRRLLHPPTSPHPWTARRLISTLFACRVMNIPCAWSGQATWVRARLDTAPTRAAMMPGIHRRPTGDPRIGRSCVPRGRSQMDPEQLLLASLSQRHMLWYLHLAADAGVTVTAYSDTPTYPYYPYRHHGRAPRRNRGIHFSSPSPRSDHCSRQ